MCIRYQVDSIDLPCLTYTCIFLFVEVNETVATIPQQVEHIVNETVKLTATFEENIYAHSLLVCNDLGGEVVNDLLINTSIDFFKMLNPAYSSFWIGK